MNLNKNYITLFNLMDENTPDEEIYERYCREGDEKSFEMAAKHLYRVVMDCLVRLREKQDTQTAIFNSITNTYKSITYAH